MKLKWLGHACFRITTEKSTSIVVDPYDESCGYGALKTSADVLIMSHAHHDHNNEQAVSGYKVSIKEVGSFAYKDIQIITAQSYHDDCGGLKRGSNLLTRIEADGESVVHLGDLGHEPNNEQLRFISNADVMLIPIGGFFTIDTETAIRIIEEAKPKAVVPMHYKTADNQYPIATAEEFVKNTKATILKTAEAEVASLRGAVIMEWDNH